MEFSCPACATPHSFPDDQVPASGIVVACTNCGTHITLDGPSTGSTGEVSDEDGATSAMDQSGGAAPMPQDWGQSDPGGDADGDMLPRTMALTGDALADLPPIGEVAPAPAPSQKVPAPPSSPPALDPPAVQPEPMVDPFKSATAPEPTVEQAQAQAQAPAAAAAGPSLSVGLGTADGAWSWRDLPSAFKSINDPKRMASFAILVWAVIVLLSVLDAFAGWLGTKVDVLGTIFEVINGVLSFAGLGIILAVAAYIGYRTTVERASPSIKDAISWTQDKILSVLGTPLVFAGAILAVALSLAILAGIGKIPYVGPILFGLTMPVTVVLGLVGGIVAVTFFYCATLYVPVIYNENTGPVETLKRLGGLFREHMLPIVGYTVVTLVMLAVAFGLTVGPVLAFDRALTSAVTGGILEADFIAMVAESPSRIGALMGTVMDPSFAMPEDEPNIGHGIGGLFGGLFATLLPALILSVVIQVLTAAGGVTYAAMTGRKK